jgi:hypothetical protein
MSAAAFCLFVRKTDRQNSEWFHIRVQYYTTRMLPVRNAAMPAPLTSSRPYSVCLSVCLSVCAEDKNNCTVYVF